MLVSCRGPPVAGGAGKVPTKRSVENAVVEQQQQQTRPYTELAIFSAPVHFALLCRTTKYCYYYYYCCYYYVLQSDAPDTTTDYKVQKSSTTCCQVLQDTTDNILTTTIYIIHTYANVCILYTIIILYTCSHVASQRPRWYRSCAELGTGTSGHSTDGPSTSY